MSKNKKIEHPIVIVDSREQLPYSFPGWDTIRSKLPSGDYSIIGHQMKFAIERKSIPDLFGCIFEGRFHRELQRLSNYPHAYLVIEGNIWKLKNHKGFSQANPKAVIGMLQAIPFKYNVKVWCLDDRDTAELFVQGLIEKYNRYVQEGGLYDKYGGDQEIEDRITSSDSQNPGYGDNSLKEKSGTKGS